jgi:cation diffusion facilitator family transporter
MRGAWLHLLGDALGSFAAFSAGLAIRLGAPSFVDPIASFVVVAILVVGALRLVRDAGLVLIEAAPAHLPIDKVRKALLGIEGIAHVDRLHVWSLGTGHDAIVAHVRVSDSDPRLCAKACESLRKRFAVEYVTLQVEPHEDHHHP